VYANQDIYLLDDVMSACDAHVAQHILQYCIRGLLAGKCVVLVTHAVAVLPHMDLVFVMEDGTIKATGSLEALQRNGFDLTHASNTLTSTDNAILASTMLDNVGASLTIRDIVVTPPVSSPSVPRAGEAVVTTAPGRLTTTEVAKEGAVTWDMYAIYIQASGGWVIVAAMLMCLLLVIACSLSTTFWLAYWSGYADVRCPGCGRRS
jgi:ATP-binding cassette subfamily C (CFTR/MRP) protein 1